MRTATVVVIVGSGSALVRIFRRWILEKPHTFLSSIVSLQARV